MWRTWWQRLTGRLHDRAPHIERHPPLTGDQDERRLEHDLFEAQTRHLGSRADVPPPPPEAPHAGGMA